MNRERIANPFAVTLHFSNCPFQGTEFRQQAEVRGVFNEEKQIT